MPAQARTVRYYVHGDLHEQHPDTYFCARCDAFVPLEHFAEPSHIQSRAERFTHSLETWKRLAKRRGIRFHRPANSENVIAAAAAADLAAAKTARSPFYRWLLRQLKREDPIGDLARDVESDKTFPATTSSREKIDSYLFRRRAGPEALVAFDEAWREFNSKGSPRVGLNLTLRFAIFKRDQYRCQLCGASAQDGKRLEVDHKVPIAKGGSNESLNLWTLCFECNRGKNTDDL